MKQRTNDKQEAAPDASRREVLARLTALCAWLLAAGVGVPAKAQGCPVDFGDGYTPDELTLDDAWEIVIALHGFDGFYTDGDLFALLWRFRALPDAEAAVWLKHLHAEVARYAAAYPDEPDVLRMEVAR